MTDNIATTDNKQLYIAISIPTTVHKSKTPIHSFTHPSALIRNPSGNPLTEHEAYNKANDLGEEAANAALNDGDGHTIAETQQRQYTTPVDVSIVEQPANPSKVL